MKKMKPYQPVSIQEVRLKDCFFSDRIRTNNDVTLPANVRTEREKELDEFVDLIISAQQKDGYLNTHFTVVEPEKRWKNLSRAHELYCAGHLMEAAVAHYKATGKRKFVDCMARYADYIAEVFGRNPGQKRGYPGHQEIELALCKLAEATGNRKYSDLAAYFINERGQSPNYFETVEQCEDTENLQADRPIREMQKLRGHSVRALYYLSGAADVAAESGDSSLFEACERLWNNVVERNMYITGGVGSTCVGEAFTADYNLPNDTAYAESCASIALVLFADRMLNQTGDARYADVMETALYNGAISGLSLGGDKFFYANPLENDDQMFEHGQQMRKRQPWFGCSCCPTNYCRFLPQIASFACSVSGDSLLINIPAASAGNVNLKNASLQFELSGSYPYDGSGTLEIQEASGECTIALRIPGWCRNWTLALNGKTVSDSPEKGYVRMCRSWKKGDRIEWNFDMPVRVLHANPRVSADIGSCADRWSTRSKASTIPRRWS